MENNAGQVKKDFLLDPELEQLLNDEEVVEEGPELATPPAPPKHSLTTIEVVARMTDNKIVTKEFVDEWLLLTFDIPTTKEGSVARNEFYKKAYALGAIQNTESVYLCPWTPEAEVMAMELAKVSNSKVIVWSRAKTTAEASLEITQRYDAGIKKIMSVISKRIDRLEEMIQKKWFKKAQKYTIKTEQLLEHVEAAIIRRGSASMLLHVAILNERFNQAFVGL